MTSASLPLHPFLNPNVDGEDRVMVVDNFQLSMFQTCPAKYWLRIMNGWKPRRQGAALGFGQILHLGLEVWYRTGDLDLAIETMKVEWPSEQFSDDFRDLAKCISVLREYVEEYPREPWTVVGYGTDQPMIETSFTLPLLDAQGNQLTTYDGYRIMYGGIIDLAFDFNGQLYIMDHKTTTRLGDYYFDQYKPNNQMTGYIWGMSQLTNRRVGGAYINAIGLYKKSATKFKRGLTQRSDEDIATWVHDIHHTCNLIRVAANTGEFPKFTSACTLYGKCEFHGVHVLSGKSQQDRFLEQEYVQETWDHESRGNSVNLDKYNEASSADG